MIKWIKTVFKNRPNTTTPITADWLNKFQDYCMQLGLIKDYVVERKYVGGNDNSWYRKWKSGRLEMGGNWKTLQGDPLNNVTWKLPHPLAPKFNLSTAMRNFSFTCSISPEYQDGSNSITNSNTSEVKSIGLLNLEDARLYIKSTPTTGQGRFRIVTVYVDSYWE